VVVARNVVSVGSRTITKRVNGEQRGGDDPIVLCNLVS
jgi:hypothetical protein